MQRGRLRVAGVVLSALVGLYTVSPVPVARAVDARISNEAIHARADTYASGTSVGTCKSFVQAVFDHVAAAAGSPMRIGEGYFGCYAAAGGEQVSLEDAARGDIVQVYRPSDRETYYWGMHVAIVVENRGGGVLDVIDANWNLDGKVRRHTWDLPGYLADYPLLTAAVWRLGTVPAAPGSPASASLSVHRFYNASSGTHFYTASEDERRMVQERWPHLFSYEGVAYVTDPARNTQPLYRFYNMKSRSHFYTASEREAQNVVSQLPHIYSFDGRAYSVCPAEVPDSVTVYRFYNMINGSHFFTADEKERNDVIERLSRTYRYEGAAFWLAQ